MIYIYKEDFTELFINNFRMPNWMLKPNRSFKKECNKIELKQINSMNLFHQVYKYVYIIQLIRRSLIVTTAICTYANKLFNRMKEKLFHHFGYLIE